MASLVTQVAQGDDQDAYAMAAALRNKPRQDKQPEQPLAPQPSDATPAPETKQKKGFWASLCCCCGGSGAQAVKPAGDQPKSSSSEPATPTAAGASSPAPADSAVITAPPQQKFLLPDWAPGETKKKTLVLDLDETLVHSSFKPIPDPDFVMSIELENVIHKVYVRKRSGVDNFLRVVGEKFEVVVFTASLAKYADPLLDILDRQRLVKKRLFREACVQHYGNYVKDLSHLGRLLTDVIIIDNSPFSYMFQPDNAIPITSWFNDKADRQLYDLLPFLEQLMYVDDVCTLLQRKRMNFQTDPEQ